MSTIQDFRNELRQRQSFSQTLASQMAGYKDNDFSQFSNPMNLKGQGQFGSVFACQRKLPNGTIHGVCLKIMAIHKGDTEKKDQIMNEILMNEIIQDGIDIPMYATDYYGFFLDQNNSNDNLHVYLVMEQGDMSLKERITQIKDNLTQPKQQNQQNVNVATKFSFQQLEMLYYYLIHGLHHLSRSRIVQSAD